jgi:hypothetical protein
MSGQAAVRLAVAGGQELHCTACTNHVPVRPQPVTGSLQETSPATFQQCRLNTPRRCATGEQELAPGWPQAQQDVRRGLQRGGGVQPRARSVPVPCGLGWRGVRHAPEAPLCPQL